jgi:hypothetical protein
MGKSAERGKGCDMYRHTFVLVSGEEIPTYSKSDKIPTMQYGDTMTFIGKNGDVMYTVPVLSILYVDTEECAEEEIC